MASCERVGPGAAGAWGVLRTGSLFALCLCFDGFNEDMKSSNSFHFAQAKWRQVGVAFPRINPHFQKWLVKLCSLRPLRAEIRWSLNY